MSTIVTRAGKGSPLTNTELDSNFSNLNTDKAELSGSTFTGNLSLGDNVKAQFGASNDLQIFHTGSYSAIKDVGTGALFIGGDNYVDIGNSGLSQTRARFYDGTVQLHSGGEIKLATTSTGISISNDANFPDNGKAIFGAGSDLQIYHSGATSFITENGTGDLRIGANNLLLRSDDIFVQSEDGTANAARFNATTGVTLYRAGSAKLATTSSGIDVTGSVVADGLTVNTGTADQVALFESTDQFADLALKDSGGTSYIRQSNGSLILEADRANASASSVALIKVDGTQVARFATGGDISFYDSSGSSQNLYWDSSTSRLGLGVTNPVSKLAMHGDAGTTYITQTITANNQTLEMGNAYSLITGASGSHSAIVSDQTLLFGTSNTERLRINADGSSVFSGSVTSTGNVSVGGSAYTTSADLNLLGDGLAIKNDKAGSSNNWSLIQNTDTGSASNLSFTTGLGVALTLNHNKSASFGANVNIGSSLMVGSTTAPTHKLEVVGNAMLSTSDGFMYLSNVGVGNAGIYVRGIGSNGTLRSHTTTDFRWEVTGGEKMLLNSSGLNVSGSVTSTGLTATNSGITLQSGSVTKSAISVAASTNQGINGTSAGDQYNWTNGGKMLWSTNNGTNAHLVLDSSGNATFSGSVSTGGEVNLRLDSTGDGVNGYDINWLNSATQGTDDRLALIRVTNEGGGGSSRGGKLSFLTRQSGNANFNSALVLNKSGNATFSGSLDLAANTSFPTAGFTLHTNGFLYNKMGSNGFIFSAQNGTEAMRINGDGTQLNIPNGSLMVGSTTVPDKTLHLKGSGTTGIAIESTTNAQNLDIDFYNNVGSAQGRIRYAEGAGEFSFAPNVSASNALTIAYDGSSVFSGSVTAPLLITNDIKATSSGGMSFQTDEGTKRLEISDAGNVNIPNGGLMVGSTSAPVARLHTRDDTSTVYDPTAYQHDLFIEKRNTSGANQVATIRFGVTGYDGSTTAEASIGVVQTSNAHSGNIVFGTRHNGTRAERARLTSGGTLLVGQTTNAETGTGIGLVPDGTSHMYSANTDALMLGRGGSDGEILSFNRSGVTKGNISVSAYGMGFGGGTRSSDFFIKTDGTASFASGVKLGVGTSSPSTNLHSNITSASGAFLTSGSVYALQLSNSDTSAGNAVAMSFGHGGFDYTNFIASVRTSTASNPKGDLVFGGRPSDGATFSERVRLTSGGQFLIGCTSAGDAGITLDGSPSGNSVPSMELVRDFSGTATMIRFTNISGSPYVGSITSTTSATAYNTSSDERLKDNIKDSDDSGSKVDAIQVRQFDWKADGEHQDYGMVAQELLEVAPDAVTQGETPDDMMGVDYSKLVPMLIKEIQSLRQRVAQLEE